MLILDASYFEGEISIGRAGNSLNTNFALTEKVNVFVKKYEPIFYRSILGETLYNDLLNGLTPDDPLDIWVKLKEKTAPMAAKFVWYFYIKDDNTAAAGVGVSLIRTESGEPKSAQPKMVNVWNELVDNIRDFSDWVSSNADDYPSLNPEFILFCRYRLNEYENLFAL